MARALDLRAARRGTDSSGRPILATGAMWLAWTAMLRDERLAPIRSRVTVVQGAFMAHLGGGATASAGYHDEAGCLDVRTWNLTSAEQQLLWDVAADYGFWFWKRDRAPAHGGMDEHGHCVVPWDAPLARGAAAQVAAARGRRDGLARNGPDYMRRRRAVRLDFPWELIEEEYMSKGAEAKLDQVLTRIADLDRDVAKLAGDEKHRWLQEWRRDQEFKKRVLALLGGVKDAIVEVANDLDAMPDSVERTGVRARLAVVDDQVTALLAAEAREADRPAPSEPGPEGVGTARPVQ